MQIGNIEQFFLNTILRILLAGVSVVLLTDLVFFPEDVLSLSIDITILLASITAFLIRQRFPTAAVLTISFIVLMAMLYQCLAVPVNTTTSLSILLILGFLYSVMLKNKTMWGMHAITFCAVHGIFIYQYINPRLRFSEKLNDLVTVAITYSILYIIISYATYVIKSRYDKIYQHLSETNTELQQKASEIASQNDELLKMHNNLNTINTHLEQIVNERTEKIQIQNAILLKYSYTNAHHLRGPVARLLGLANLYKQNLQPDPDFIIEKMTDQANEIDVVIKQINTDLDTKNLAANPAKSEGSNQIG